MRKARLTFVVLAIGLDFFAQALPRLGTELPAHPDAEGGAADYAEHDDRIHAAASAGSVDRHSHSSHGRGSFPGYCPLSVGPHHRLAHGGE